MGKKWGKIKMDKKGYERWIMRVKKERGGEIIEIN